MFDGFSVLKDYYEKCIVIILYFFLKAYPKCPVSPFFLLLIYLFIYLCFLTFIYRYVNFM